MRLFLTSLKTVDYLSFNCLVLNPNGGHLHNQSNVQYFVIECPSQPDFQVTVQPEQPNGLSTFDFSGINIPVALQPAYEGIIEWILTTSADAYLLSNKAVVAGYEAYDKSPLWVIRAKCQCDLLPGKLALHRKTAYVPWGGYEFIVNDIEVCCAGPDKVQWVQNTGGAIPQYAIVAGNTRCGEPLYIGRANIQGSLTPGKVQPSRQVMYLSYNGQELSLNVYEILCMV